MNKRVQSLVNGYKPPVGKFPVFKRVAHFLNEGAIKAPLDFFTYQEVAKAIFKNSDTVIPKKNQLDLVKHSASKAREILWDDYGKGLESKRGIGIRATVGAADAMHNDVIPHQNRIFNSAEKLSRKIKKVDRKELGQAPMGKMLLDAHNAAKSLVNQVLTDNTWQRLKQLKEKNENE
jgi:hypothetical protein